MKKILLFILAISTVSGVFAQPKEQNMELKSGTVLNDVVGNDLQYAFEDFTNGVILHSNGETSMVKLNYSYLAGEMLYLDPSTKEVKAVAGSSNAVLVSILGRKFIPGLNDREYMEVISEGDIELAVRKTNKVFSMGKKGAYGTTNMAGHVQSVSTYGTGVNNAGGQSYEKLQTAEELRISLDRTYYLVNSKNNKRTFVNGVKSYLKAYPKDKSALIEQYMNENKVDFKNENDLAKLTAYCNKP